VIVDKIVQCRQKLTEEGGRKMLKRIQPVLMESGIKLGRDTLFELLRKYDLGVKWRKNYVRTTNSLHRFHVYSNLIKEIKAQRSNEVWVSDITYISTRAGFMYLALITDAYSRKIVGYDISDSLELHGCLRALKMALAQRSSTLPLIHHSDRGIQYCSHAYTRLLNSNNVQISMAAKGNCYENAMAERVNGILKKEFYLDQEFASKKVAVNAVKDAIYRYNYVRFHLRLNYQTPASVHAA